MFKQLVGTQKAEFATNKQQDAQEFLQFLLDLIHKREHTKNDGVDPTEVPLRFHPLSLSVLRASW